MLREDQIAADTGRLATSLDDAVSSLVREANEAGGRDNITVVAFRLEEAAAGGRGRGAADLDRPCRRGGRPDRGRAGRGSRRREATRPARPIEGAASHPGASPPLAAPCSPRRWQVVAIAAVVVRWRRSTGFTSVYFLGTDSGGRVALYRGLPYDLPLGIKLYSEVYAAPVQVSAIPARPARQRRPTTRCAPAPTPSA